MSPPLAHALLLLAGALWGGGFIAQQTAMDSLGPLSFIGFRFLIAGLVFLPFAGIEIRRSVARGNVLRIRKLLPLLWVGLVFFLGMALQQIGLLATTVTQAGFLTGLYIVMVPMILLFILKEPQPRLIWLAAGLALFGTWLLGQGGITDFGLGEGLILSCAVFWAIHVILVGKIGTRTGLPITLAVVQFFVASGLGFLGYVLARQLGFEQEPALKLEMIQSAWTQLAYAGIFAGGLAFTLQSVAMRYTKESTAAILLSSESLFAALFGALLLGDRLGSVGYVGCGLIFGAMVLVECLPKEDPA